MYDDCNTYKINIKGCINVREDPRAIGVDEAALPTNSGGPPTTLNEDPPRYSMYPHYPLTAHARAWQSRYLQTQRRTVSYYSSLGRNGQAKGRLLVLHWNKVFGT